MRLVTYYSDSEGTISALLTEKEYISFRKGRKKYIILANKRLTRKDANIIIRSMQS